MNNAFTPAQVAEPFLADVGDEGDGAGGSDAPGVQRTRNRDEDGQAAAVVADARSAQHGTAPRHLDVGLGRKHRVEVRGDHQVRPRRGAPPLGDHVAGRVDAHVLQASPRQGVAKDLRAGRLVERRRRHLAEPDLVGNRLLLARAGMLERRFDVGTLRQRGDLAGRLRRHREIARGHSRQVREHDHRESSTQPPHGSDFEF